MSKHVSLINGTGSGKLAGINRTIIKMGKFDCGAGGWSMVKRRQKSSQRIMLVGVVIVGKKRVTCKQNHK